MNPERSFHIHIESAGEPWKNVRVQRFSGREWISQLFSFDLEVVCDAESELPEKAYSGAEVSIVIEVDDQEVRRIHGQLGPIVDRLEPNGDHRTYVLNVKPRMFWLTLVETQEIYLDVTIPEVIQRKLEMYGFGAEDFEMRLHGSYPKREIVVQYGETDLAFVSRLAEHLGISFFFEHDSDKSKVVFTDSPSGFRPLEGREEVVFHPRGEAAGVFSLYATTDAVSGTYLVQDYNYRTPQLDPNGQHRLEAGGQGGVVEYGSHVKSPDEAEQIARIRGEERAATTKVYEGKSSEPTLEAGRRVALVDHPRLAAREELLLLEVRHEASTPFFHKENTEPPVYRSEFRAIPAGVVYRPPRRTPKPRMPSVVTGIVQPGPGGVVGGTAMLDTEGRYTVQLHFDTAPPGGSKSSHPVRMAQPFAGQGNAMHFPLLPGTEVLVAFANGDPDRPIIIGALPNVTSPSAINVREARKHRLETSKGILVEFGITDRVRARSDKS